MKREIPHMSGLPIDGWLFNPKGMPIPLNCSWCDEEYVITDSGLVLCPDCDRLDLREAS